MNAINLLPACLLVAVVPARGAAQPQSSAPSGAFACNQAKAQFAVGDRYSAEIAERARHAAGARIVRKVEPGGAYTTELRADRLNLEVDGSDIVREVSCG